MTIVDMRQFEFVPSSPPSVELWEQRRQRYDHLLSAAMNPGGSTTCQHSGELKWELERCFCSGAWVACIILSEAVCEIHLSEEKKRGVQKDRILNELGLLDEHRWLKDRRNTLAHNRSEGRALSSHEYRRESEKLENEAVRAIRIVLTITLNNPPEVSERSKTKDR